jgi:hypothetical protein
MNADPKADWTTLGFGEHSVEMVRIAGDHRGRIERCRQAVVRSVLRPNKARSPSPRYWFGWPPASITACETAARKRLMMNTVVKGSRFCAISVELRMSTNMHTR